MCNTHLSPSEYNYLVQKVQLLDDLRGLMNRYQGWMDSKVTGPLVGLFGKQFQPRDQQDLTDPCPQ